MLSTVLALLFLFLVLSTIALVAARTYAAAYVKGIRDGLRLWPHHDANPPRSEPPAPPIAQPDVDRHALPAGESRPILPAPAARRVPRRARSRRSQSQ